MGAVKTAYRTLFDSREKQLIAPGAAEGAIRLSLSSAQPRTRSYMKKLRRFPHPLASQTVCTVSAAALMLGVSHAATVGFNFQAQYCSAASYTGATVTAPAFGIGTNNWESLPPMPTGYGCDASGPYTLNQVIDSLSSGAGLNPLPRGSLNVTWSASSANVSGFGGYDRSGPHYTFGGNSYHPGEEQVYWGFLRDGVNFGPGSSGGDNNQPGYQIDIKGLKSLFPNNPFVVELVASSDSLSSLTNAFVIDATLSTTQSVVYPSIPPVSNSGDTPWTRGVGGGLSTGSGSVSTDHLIIMGNRAAHGTNSSPGGFNFASTIAGFIITDQPVVTMPPRSVLAAPGDTVTLSPMVIGVPPLAYQWLQNGVAVPGATNASLTLNKITAAGGGNYTLAVTNLYGSVTSPTATITVDHLTVAPQPFVLDSKPQGVEQDAADSGALWLATDRDSRGTTRTGLMQFSAASPGQITVPVLTTNMDSATGTITFWMRSAGTVTNTGNEGAIIFDRRTDSGFVIAQEDDGTLYVQTAPSSTDQFGSLGNVSDNSWHQITVTWDQSATGFINLYIDGHLDNSGANTKTWSWPVGQEIELGRSHDSYWRPYNGLLDDFRIYNRARTDAEIAQVAADGLADTSALQLRLNFDAAPVPGVTMSWLISGATLQSADSVNGPYTDVPGATSPFSSRSQSSQKFYRYRHNPVTTIDNPYVM